MIINLYGCGNMTQAIFHGLKGLPVSIQIHTYTPTYTKAFQLAQEFKGKAYKSIFDMPHSKFVFLGCKPQQFSELADDLKKTISKESVVISIMAGIEVGTIQNALDVRKVVRVMPSTPSFVNEGISLLFASKDVQPSELEELKILFKTVSKIINVNSEDELDILTTVSGCGPGYIFEISRILSDYLQSKGINPGTSDLVTAQLIVGAGKLMNESHQSFKVLRDNVTSKGGMTYEIINHLEQSDLQNIFNTALEKAYKKAKILGSS